MLAMDIVFPEKSDEMIMRRSYMCRMRSAKSKAEERTAAKARKGISQYAHSLGVDL